MKDKINIICFCILLGLFCALILLMPNDKNVETMENRSLNKAPKLDLRAALSGEFSKQFEGFIADRVAFRTDFIKVSKNVESAYGIVLEGEPVIVLVGSPSTPDGREPKTEAPARDGIAEHTPGTEVSPPPRASEGSLVKTPRPDSDSASTGTSLAESGGKQQLPVPSHGGEELLASTEEDESGNRNESDQPQPDDGDTAQGSEDSQPGIIEPTKAGPLLVFPDRLMEVFGYSEKVCIRYADVINAYAQALEGKGRVFSLVAPTQIEFVDEKYKSVSDSQQSAIAAVYSRLEVACPVNAYSYLSAHKDEYIYFRTDHHWTALGAYYAYLAFCNSAGIEPVTIDNYNSFELPGFLGYLYNISPSKVLEENPDTIVYYELKAPIEVSNMLLRKPTPGGKVTYSIFIGGDNPIYHINTSVKNGRTCMIIKDSYGNAFVPWLAPHYEDIFVFDPRHFDGSVTKMLEDYEDVDLIVLNYAFVAGAGGFVEAIDGIR